MRAIILFSLIILAILAVPLPAEAQAQQTVPCSVCNEPNKPGNNFCTSCGAKFTAAVAATDDGPFTYREPARLFSVPTASVLQELALGITLGNSFGQQEQQSFLGNLALGIGDVAELELNTGGMVGNIVAGTTRMTTWGLKVQVMGEQESVPSIALSLRSSHDWDNTKLNGEFLRTEAPDHFREGLRWLDYNMRMTTAAVSFSRSVNPFATLHATVGLSDLRYKNLGAQYATNNSRSYDSGERRTSQWQAAGGFALYINPRTKVIGEIQTIPFFDYNMTQNTLHLKRMYVGAAGVRFALSKAFTLDSGVRYQSNFVGLADTQVRVALNGVFVIPL